MEERDGRPAPSLIGKTAGACAQVSAETGAMTSTTNPIHPAAVAIDSEERGFFQPFTDLRSDAQKARDGEGFATPLRTSDGGESVGSRVLREALHASIRMDPPTRDLMQTSEAAWPFPEAPGTHAHSITDPGHTHPIYVGSLDEPGHFHDVTPASLSGLVGDRFPEAANDHHCAGRLSPECMTEAEFVESMERQRAHWNGLIDAMLDTAAPGWREERARQQAEAA